MTVKELKNLLEDVPDDFEFEVWREVKEESSWGYDIVRHKVNPKNYDVGWSDRKMHIHIDDAPE